jgi:tellurite resistance protein TerC
MLAFDIGVFNKKNHEVKFKEAFGFTLLWVSIALIFWGLIYFYGHMLHDIQDMDHLREIIALYDHKIELVDGNLDKSLAIYRRNLGLEYLTGYIIEYSLSIDNIFVILMIFISFGVEKRFYHKVLFWGILGAILMRFLFIFISAAFIQQFSWALYFFGALLIFTAIKLFMERNKTESIDTQNHFIVKFAGRFLRVDEGDGSGNFFYRKEGKIFVTSLFIILLVIEFSDVIFAVDSVPAIFSVTKDPFIVYFSNIFAIIGLRSLFFLLASIIDKFRFLKVGLSLLLVFIGLKMLLHNFIEISTLNSLLIVLIILFSSIVVSVIIPEKKTTGE